MAVGRDLRQHQGSTGVALRTDRAEDIGRAIALIFDHARPLTTQEPASRHPTLLADTGFVQEPDLKPLRLRLCGDNPIEHLPELFLNAVCAAASLCGCCGRGVCHDKSSPCSSFARPLSE